MLPSLFRTVAPLLAPEVQPFAFDRLVGDVGDVLVQLVFVYAVLYAVSVCHGGQVFPVPFEFYCRCRVFGQCDGFLASAVCRYSELGLDIGYRVVRRVVDVVDQLVLVNPVCDFLVAQVDGHCIISCRKFYCRRGRFSQFYLAGRRSRFQVEACFQVADVCLVVLDGIVVGDCVVQLVFVQSQAQPVVVDCRLDVFIAFDCQRRGRVDGLCPFRVFASWITQFTSPLMLLTASFRSPMVAALFFWSSLAFASAVPFSALFTLLIVDPPTFTVPSPSVIVVLLLPAFPFEIEVIPFSALASIILMLVLPLASWLTLVLMFSPEYSLSAFVPSPWIFTVLPSLFRTVCSAVGSGSTALCL